MHRARLLAARPAPPLSVPKSQIRIDLLIPLIAKRVDRLLVVLGGGAPLGLLDYVHATLVVLVTIFDAQALFHSNLILDVIQLVLPFRGKKLVVAASVGVAGFGAGGWDGAIEGGGG